MRPDVECFFMNILKNKEIIFDEARHLHRVDFSVF